MVFVDEGEDKYTISMTMNGVTMTYKASTKKPVGPDINGKMQSAKVILFLFFMMEARD